MEFSNEDCLYENSKASSPNTITAPRKKGISVASDRLPEAAKGKCPTLLF